MDELGQFKLGSKNDFAPNALTILCLTLAHTSLTYFGLQNSDTGADYATSVSLDAEGPPGIGHTLHH